MLAPRPYGACCFRFLTKNLLFFLPDPVSRSLQCSCMTPVPPQGPSRGQYDVMYFGYCAARMWLCHLTQADVSPHLKRERAYPPATYYSSLQQCSYAVSQLVSRLRFRNLERHDVWRHIFFVSYMQVRTWCLVHTSGQGLYVYCSCTTCSCRCWLLHHKQCTRRPDRRLSVACTYVCTVVLQLTAQHVA